MLPQVKELLSWSTYVWSICKKNSSSIQIINRIESFTGLDFQLLQMWLHIYLLKIVITCSWKLHNMTWKSYAAKHVKFAVITFTTFLSRPIRIATFHVTTSFDADLSLQLHMGENTIFMQAQRLKLRIIFDDIFRSNLNTIFMISFWRPIVGSK